MKLIYGLLVLVLLVVSCGPGTQESNTGTVAPEATSQDSGSKLGANQAWVLYHDLAMWKEGEAKLKWMGSLAIGDKVEVLGNKGQFIAEGSSDSRDYVKIRYGGKEAWVRDIFLANAGRMGVLVMDKAKVYSEARAIKVTAKHVNGPGMVAVLEEKDGYLKIQGYDYTSKVLFDGETWVSADSVSLAANDVGAASLWIAASVATKKEIRVNLLATALEQHGDSVLAEKIRTDLAALEEVVLPASEAVDTRFVVNDDKVNVRSGPAVDSAVLATLDKGAEVLAIEKTLESFTIGTSTASWFRISEPAGWIFGAFLDSGE